MQKNQFLTVKEAAGILKIHILTVYEYIKEGKLHALRLGRNYRIDIRNLNKFIKENTI